MRNFRACAVRLLAFATVGAFFAAPAMAQTKPPLRIAGCFSATGPAACAGAGALKTVEMLVESTNKVQVIIGRWNMLE